MKQDFQRMLVILANNYPQTTISEENIKAICFFIERSIGFNHDWPSVMTKIAAAEKFFPNASVVIEYAVGKPKSDKDLAQSFVDEAILAFTSTGNTFEQLGREKYNLAKRIGLDKFSIQNGSVDPRYMRSQWIDRYIKLSEEGSPEEIEGRSPSNPLITSKIAGFIKDV